MLRIRVVKPADQDWYYLQYYQKFLWFGYWRNYTDTTLYFSQHPELKKTLVKISSSWKDWEGASLATGKSEVSAEAIGMYLLKQDFDRRVSAKPPKELVYVPDPD
jgi:hypothetical protein